MEAPEKGQLRNPPKKHKKKKKTKNYNECGENLPERLPEGRE